VSLSTSIAVIRLTVLDTDCSLFSWILCVLSLPVYLGCKVSLSLLVLVRIYCLAAPTVHGTNCSPLSWILRVLISSYVSSG
jgi:hypothetical protein